MDESAGSRLGRYRIWTNQLVRVLDAIEYWIRIFPNSKFQIPNSVHRGFTLIETMVALSVLLISVVGPISLIGNSLHNIYYARDQVVAINLAQEGVELVRRVRDSNLLAVSPWNTGLGVGSYIADAPLFSLVASADDKVYQDTDGFYRQGTGFPVASQFSRIVNIETIQPGIEMKVTSTVTWETGNTAGTVTVSDFLFNLTP